MEPPNILATIFHILSEEGQHLTSRATRLFKVSGEPIPINGSYFIPGSCLFRARNKITTVNPNNDLVKSDLFYNEFFFKKLFELLVSLSFNLTPSRKSELNINVSDLIFHQDQQLPALHLRPITF